MHVVSQSSLVAMSVKIPELQKISGFSSFECSEPVSRMPRHPTTHNVQNITRMLVRVDFFLVIVVSFVEYRSISTNHQRKRARRKLKEQDRYEN